MNYLTLTRQEIKELLHIRVRDFLMYVMALILLSFVFQEVLRIFLPDISTADLFFAVIFFVTVYLWYIWHINKRYFFEIIVSRKKRVYTGVLSNKSINRLSSESKYCFNMDGHIFHVSKEIFQQFEEGDLLGFHISPSTKHLFKVEKVK